MSVTINGTNGLTFTDNSTQNTAATDFGFKNRIINGAMMIDQRNAGASITPSITGLGVGYLVDRFYYQPTQASKFSFQQNAGGVTLPVGFTNYLGATVASAYIPTSTDTFNLVQSIEGLNVADLGWGTANAQSVTVSFLVYSSLTGSFPGSIYNYTGNRSYPFLYTVSAANTWTKITLTIPGDTSGTWLTTNGIGISVCFNLGAGSNYQGTPNSWNGSWKPGATGGVNVVATAGATFYITGVQLEKGSTATSFDYRPYGTELALCQRYFWSSFATIGATPSGWPSNFLTTAGMQSIVTTGMINMAFNYQVPMRATPTGSTWDHTGTAGKISSFNPNSANNAGESGGVVNASPYLFILQRVSGSNASAIGCYLQLSAEL